MQTLRITESSLEGLNVEDQCFDNPDDIDEEGMETTTQPDNDRSLSQMVSDFVEEDQEAGRNLYEDYESSDPAADEEEAFTEGDAETDEPTGDEVAEDEQLRIERTGKRVKELFRPIRQIQFEIGDAVLEEFHGGEIERASSNDPHKLDSYKSIIEVAQISVAPRTLNSWVLASVTRKRFLNKGLDLPNLEASHYIELAVERNEDRQEKLAVEANEKGYTVGKLRSRIREQRPKATPRPVSVKAGLKKELQREISFSVDKKVVDFVSDESAVKDTYKVAQLEELLNLLRARREEVAEYGEFLDIVDNTLGKIFSAEK